MDINWLKLKTGIDPGVVNAVLKSRRAWVAILAVLCLTVLGLVNKIDTSVSIAAVATAIAAANGYEKKGKPE
jgi:hypothetical protein